RCGRAMSALSWYGEAQRRYRDRVKEQPLRIEKNEIKHIVKSKTADVTEYEAKQVLAAYGIPVTREELAKSAQEAVAIAKRIGYPVAIKVQSPDISHKTEAKAVRLKIASDTELAAAYEEVLAN